MLLPSDFSKLYCIMKVMMYYEKLNNRFDPPAPYHDLNLGRSK